MLTKEEIDWLPPGAQRNHERRQYHRDMRQKTITAYGAKCACCGYDDRRFLTVDHIFNDGKTHRTELEFVEGKSIHEYLFDEGYPTDRFQLLCYNCNCAKQFNTVRKGVCPHQLDREEIALVNRQHEVGTT